MQGLERVVMPMSREQFESEKNYRVALSIAKAMLSKGLISTQEYSAINTMLIAKYSPIIGSLTA